MNGPTKSKLRRIDGEASFTSTEMKSGEQQGIFIASLQFTHQVHQSFSKRVLSVLMAELHWSVIERLKPFIYDHPTT